MLMACHVARAQPESKPRPRSGLSLYRGAGGRESEGRV